MLKKTKKLLFLSTGLAGALATSAVAGVALSSCTVETVNSGSGSSDGITLPDTWYNKDINWTDATSLNNLIIDKEGFVYSNKYMTEIIAVLPGYDASTITIPASVRTISGYNSVTTNESGQTVRTPTGAFQGLTSLTKVVFAGKNVTQIGANAFKGCSNLQTITLPSSVTLVDSNAFNGCSTLNSINLDNVQYIGVSAFEGAMTDVPDGLVKLNLNKTVLIGSNAFKGVTGIGSVDFSKNTTLTQIADGAFSGCTKLTGDIDLSNATKLITIGNATTPAANGSSFLNTAITNVYLPSTSGLRTIAASTFSGCTNLVTVAPKGIAGFKATESISGIYNQAFAGTKITTADISSVTSLTPLYEGAFSDMAELASVNLGTTITTIPASCFMNCSALTTLTLPASITSISGGTPAFGTSSGSITFSGTAYPAFYGSGLTSIDLSTVTSYQTTSTSAALNLPDTLFYNCAALQTVTLKDGTTSIGQGSFAGTTALSTITTKTSTRAGDGYVATKDITTVGKYAFWKSGISSVDLSAMTSSSYTKLFYLTFTSCPNLTTIKLPNTITSIEGYAVNETPELATVNFGDLALASMGDYNFLNCKLKEIDLTKTTITDFAQSTNNLFSGLSKDTVVKLSPKVWNISSSLTFTYNETTTENGTTTTKQVPINVTYPNGFAPDISATLANSNLANHTMFSRISGSLDMSSFTALRSIGVRSFFGGAETSLTFNASQFASGKYGSYYSSSSQTWGNLGFLGAKATSGTNSGSLEYATTSLPFGSMTKLSNITFNSFSSATTTDSSTETTNVLAKTTFDTWRQVARIISSFAKSAKTDTSSSVVTNLSEWNSNGVTAQVQEDTSGLVTSVTLTNNDDASNTLTISDSNSSENTFTYEGVVWTVKIDAENGTITLTSSSDIDTYQLSVLNSSSSGYDTFKAFFNTKSETSNDADGNQVTTIVPDSSITVTLNVVPQATTPSTASVK